MARKPRPRPEQRAVYAAAGKLERQALDLLLTSLRAMQAQVNLTEVARLVQEATPDQVYSVLMRGAGGQSVEAIATVLATGTAEAVAAGAELAAEDLGGVAILDMGRPGLKSWLADNAAKLITAIDDGSRAAVASTIKDGVLRGRHPMRLARDIQQSIGLTERDAGAVARMRATLEAKGLPTAQIEARADRYAAKLLKARAETIAQNETMTAVNKGREALWGQLVEDGALRPGQKKRWLTGLDEMVCPVCEPMHATTVELGQPWELPNGKSVTSPPAHIRCRCTEVLLRPPPRGS